MKTVVRIYHCLYLPVWFSVAVIPGVPWIRNEGLNEDEGTTEMCAVNMKLRRVLLVGTLEIIG